MKLMASKVSCTSWNDFINSQSMTITIKCPSCFELLRFYLKFIRSRDVFKYKEESNFTVAERY